jgi:hypothetical protein
MWLVFAAALLADLLGLFVVAVLCLDWSTPMVTEFAGHTRLRPGSR